MRFITIAMMLIVVGVPLWAQAPDTVWTRTFGLADYDIAWGVEETADSGYLITGISNSMTYPGWEDILIIKLNRDGSTAWTKRYGTDTTSDWAQCGKKTSDGGYIVAGQLTGWYGDEANNYFLMKLDANGDSLWTRGYDYDTTNDWGQDVCQTLDGGYIMVGTSYYWSPAQGGYDWSANIVRADPNGNKPNHLLIDIKYSQDLHRVTATADGGAIAIGQAGAFYIVKINKYGDTTWVKGYGGVGDGWDILQLADGGYMAFGDRDFGGSDDEDFWLLRLDTLGDTLWSKRYQSPAPDYGYGLEQTADGGFVMAGTTYRNGGVDPTDFLIIRTDADGDTLWTKTIGGDYGEYATDIRQTSDGGYIVVGRTESFGAGYWDFYVVKLAPDNPSAADDIASPRPTAFSLGANYPNPFNPGTTIEYALDRRAVVRIDIVNLLGQTVRTLVHGPKEAGSYRITWDGTDDAGRPAATGVYFYRLQADSAVRARKMLLLK